jgi:hypothetical protein
MSFGIATNEAGVAAVLSCVTDDILKRANTILAVNKARAVQITGRSRVAFQLLTKS